MFPSGQILSGAGGASSSMGCAHSVRVVQVVAELFSPVCVEGGFMLH